MINELSRRRFLSQASIGVSAAWVSAHWPEMVSASTHAHEAMQSGAAYKFEFFTPAEATEIDALSARIIPTDDTPGAREAGVLYFIDRALVTFANGDQQTYRDGLVELQSAVREKFPGVEKFSAATPAQQDELLHAMEPTQDEKAPRRRRVNTTQTFLEALRVQTIAGFLIDPETGLGNRGGVGWKVIGREPAHSFQPPFGYYDKDYPGWQPAPKMADKE
ncbi:MAG TPA: gluconate 2-dehydrogenase subunit 3 family protein [Methylomirabilota bacterium]|jgi:gluconate 2-dehydrogenase gamma chain|nr:gluconate 2-dehydrogenase subunit 3 family protein [Methylomirabilota bacterium]